MINRNKASILKCIIHKVGNKHNDTKNAFSENELQFDEDSYNLMLPFLLRPFTSLVQSHRFNHHANIELNEINAYTKQIFSDDTAFVDTSINIVKHLYEQSTSAQIKTGDVIVAYIDGIEYNEMVIDAVGIFKIENKTSFFQTYLENNSYDVLVQKGINAKKVDKGCLILNTGDAEGKVVLTVDNNNYDAAYWTDKFLNIKYADDYNSHTQNYLELCKEFSTEVIKTSYGSKERNDFLAKTIDFFKENFEAEQNVIIRNQFDVSEKVLNKEKKKIKTEIKLDTHIQIKLDIDAPDAASEHLERGYDEDKKMHYYKVYFNAEG